MSRLAKRSWGDVVIRAGSHKLRRLQTVSTFAVLAAGGAGAAAGSEPRKHAWWAVAAWAVLCVVFLLRGGTVLARPSPRDDRLFVVALGLIVGGLVVMSGFLGMIKESAVTFGGGVALFTGGALLFVAALDAHAQS